MQKSLNVECILNKRTIALRSLFVTRDATGWTLQWIFLSKRISLWIKLWRHRRDWSMAALWRTELFAWCKSEIHRISSGSNIALITFDIIFRKLGYKFCNVYRKPTECDMVIESANSLIKLLIKNHRKMVRILLRDTSMFFNRLGYKRCTWNLNCQIVDSQLFGPLGWAMVSR